MTLSDYEAVRAFYEEPGILDYMEPFFPKEKEEQRAFFESYVKNMYAFYDCGMYAILENDTGKLIGLIGLDCIGEKNEKACYSLGYAISKSCQGRGIGYDCCRRVLTDAYERLDPEVIEIHIKPENLPSIALANKLKREFPLLDITIELEKKG